MTTKKSPPHLAIKDWKKHQHYTDRRPPWIKLYTRLLDDPAFMGLCEAAQAQLVKLWVLAANMGHPLPNDPRLLAGKIGVRGKFHLDAIIAAGFLNYCYQEPEEVGENLLAEVPENPTILSTESREQSTETTAREEPERPPPAVPQYDQIFAEAWSVYPRRPNHSKGAAWRQWLARVGEGVDPLDMLEGARRYAKLVESERTEPRFIKHASTFFGRDKHFENDMTPVVARDALAVRVADLVAEEDAALSRTAAILAARGAA